MRVRWPFMVMGILVLLAAGATATAIYTKYFQVKRVHFEPQEYADKLPEMNLSSSQNIFTAPLKEAADYLLAQQMVAGVAFRYELPDGIAIRVDEVQPVVYVLGLDRTKYYGVDERGRLIPCLKARNEIDLPVILGAKNNGLYQRISDAKVKLILPQLIRVKAECLEFYQSIATIDLATEDSMTAFIDGIAFCVVMRPGDFYKETMMLKQFLFGYSPDLSEITRLDLRTDGQIVATRKKCQKQGSLRESTSARRTSGR